jgi:GNAT superfamily N-acetyltransferase
MIDRTRSVLHRAAKARERVGVGGAARQAFHSLLVQWSSLRFVNVMALDRERMNVPDLDVCFKMSFLTPEQVRRFAENPANQLPADFAERAERGWDLCYGAIHGDRLASYGWYALHSVEAEHGAGTPLGLPRDTAYLYKGFTHPDFRGQRLYAACMGWALTALGERQGVKRLLAFVYWNNTPSLSGCLQLGYDRLGTLVIGPKGPVRVPREARRLGVSFGDEAKDALRHRLLEAPAMAAEARA